MRPANPSRSWDYVFQNSFSMRLGRPMPPLLCLQTQALQLGLCPGRVRSPCIASSLLLPMGQLWLVQPMGRGGLASNMSLLCLRIAAYACTVWDKKDWFSASLQTEDQKCQMFLSSFWHVVRENSTGICWVFMFGCLFGCFFFLNWKVPGYLKSHQKHQNGKVICMPLTVLLLNCRMNCSINGCSLLLYIHS